MARFREAIGARDWEAARVRGFAAAEIAERRDDANAMLLLGDSLERLGEFGTANRLLAKGGRLTAGATGVEWDAAAAPGLTLLVEQRIRDIGAPIRQARLIGFAAERVGRCVVLCEPRLVPLLRRTFPTVEVRPRGFDDDAVRHEAQLVASYETLAWRLAGGPADMARRFRPLQPDRALTGALRERYLAATGGRPLIGISWGSANTAKDLPPLAPWAELIRSVPASFVSLQYGDIARDVDELLELGAPVMVDDSIDALSVLDRFAAQVAAMDGVVTISNTTAHMAGALARPMIVVLDDRFHLTWPIEGDRTPWYPDARLERKHDRSWGAVFAAVEARLRAMVASGRTSGAPV